MGIRGTRERYRSWSGKIGSLIHKLKSLALVIKMATDSRRLNRSRRETSRHSSHVTHPINHKTNPSPQT